MMKVIKVVLSVVAILLLLLVVAVVAKDLWIKSVVTAAASQVLGAPVSMDSFRLSFIKQDVAITNLRVQNPAGFPQGNMVVMPKIFVSLDVDALRKGTLHLRAVEIDLSELGLTKNKDGKLNVDALKVASKEEKAPAGKKETRMMPMAIDELRLKVGKLVFSDYSLGGQPVVKVQEVNLDKAYKNITSPQQLAALVLTEPMKAAGIQGAAIYGAAMLSGVGIVPLAVGSFLTGKDTTKAEFDKAFEPVFDKALAAAQKLGKILSEDRSSGTIKATVSGASVVIRVQRAGERKTQVSVSAKKFLMPQPEVAGGVLHELTQGLS